MLFKGDKQLTTTCCSNFYFSKQSLYEKERTALPTWTLAFGGCVSVCWSQQRPNLPACITQSCRHTPAHPHLPCFPTFCSPSFTRTYVTRLSPYKHKRSAQTPSIPWREACVERKRRNRLHFKEKVLRHLYTLKGKHFPCSHQITTAWETVVRGLNWWEVFLGVHAMRQEGGRWCVQMLQELPSCTESYSLHCTLFIMQCGVDKWGLGGLWVICLLHFFSPHACINISVPVPQSRFKTSIYLPYHWT